MRRVFKHFGILFFWSLSVAVVSTAQFLESGGGFYGWVSGLSVGIFSSTSAVMVGLWLAEREKVRE
jgi:hypothetical protein